MHKSFILASAIILFAAANSAQASADKVAICHLTSSSKNPVVLIETAADAQVFYDRGDFPLPAGMVSCPVTPPPPPPPPPPPET